MLLPVLFYLTLLNSYLFEFILEPNSFYILIHLILTHTPTHTHVDTLLRENSSSAELVGIKQYISPCPLLNLSLNSYAVEDPVVILDHSDFMNFSMQLLKCVTLKLYLILILCFFQ